jgi:hypothetical protein
MLELYRRLPEEVRRCIRPINLLEECAALLPGRGNARALRVAEMARRLALLGRTRFLVRRLEGPGRGTGARLACVLASDEPSARYWSRAFFAESPTLEVLGEVGALAVPRVAARLAGGAELSLWQTPWPVSRCLGRRARVPSWVPLWLATDRPLEAVIEGARSGRAARKNDVRRVARLGLRVRVATEPAAYELFRRELYEPYGRSRFGDLFVPLPAHVLRHARRYGRLLLLERDGRPVAGTLLARRGPALAVLAFGVRPDASLPPGSGLEACYLHAIRFAVESRIPCLQLGSCRPALSDGVLRYKRKWGARLGRPETLDVFLLRYRNTAAVRGAFTAVPLLIHDGRGGLAALVGASGTKPEEQLRRVDTPGLGELVCLLDDPSPSWAALRAPHSALRVVPAPEVWPAAAA